MSRLIMQQALDSFEAIMFEKDAESCQIIAKNARYSLREALAQPEQESPHSAKGSADSAKGFGKREWVGLTDDEIKKIMQRWRGEFDIRDIERLLKEKNT